MAENGPRDGETLDLLFGAKVPLIQARHGHRTSVDALALAWFAWWLAQQTGQEVRRVCDLGAGTGLVSLLLGRAWPQAELHLLELQPQQAERCLRNLALSGLGARSSVHCADLAAPLAMQGWADVAVSNPPFRVPGRELVTANSERRLAHFESSASLEVFAERLMQAISADGMAGVVYPWHGVVRAETALRRHARYVGCWPLCHRRGDATPVRAMLAASQRPLPEPCPLALHGEAQPDSQYVSEIQDFLSIL